jgi:hypothetical protein
MLIALDIEKANRTKTNLKKKKNCETKSHEKPSKIYAHEQKTEIKVTLTTLEKINLVSECEKGLGKTN